MGSSLRSRTADPLAFVMIREWDQGRRLLWHAMMPRQRSSSAMRRVHGVVRGRIRRWREDKPGGLAVIDIALELVSELGGRRQMRTVGSLNGVPFAGSTMLVAGGGFRVGVPPAAPPPSRVSVGDQIGLRP